MPLPTSELKLGYELFSKLVGWAVGRRKSKQLEALTSVAFRELLKGDAADLDLVASVLKELHKAADTSAKALRLSTLYDAASKPKPARAAKPDRRRKPSHPKPDAKD